MFDWNDQELTNIIWGEAGETDDHIVPYQDGSENCQNKKERSEDTAAKSTEQKTPGDKVDLHRKKLEGGTDLNANGRIATSRFGMDLWPELSLSSAAKTDHDSMASEVSENLIEVTECSSKNGKEQGDFVDYSWANIGSFDDLDRIFSNDDPIFGNVSLGTADELWSSSKETNAETGGETSAPKSHLVAEKVMTPNVLADKEYRQNKLLKFLKKPEDMGKSKIVQNIYGSRIPSGNLLIQCEKNSATSMVKSSPSSVATQQRQLQGSDSLQYQHISNTFVAPSTYGNLTNQYPTIPVLSNIQSREIYHQPLLPSYEVSPVKSNPVNRSAPTAAKSSRMTPQEKIEKLRRRQQMQALLAIKNQQQQFTHQVPSTNHAVFQNFSQENQFQLAEDVEDLSPLASFDPNSPLEKNDSNTVAVAIDDHSAEDTVLNQLQDIIAKLDIRTRLCIRDSLFRLAQSAMQRHYASNTSSTSKISKDENEVSNEDKNHSRMSETETETNPIDRTVAHLLFHRPLVLSRKHPQTPESPASTKLPCEGKTVSKVPSPLLDPKHVEQFTNSPFVDAYENAPNNQPADGGVSQRNLELF